MRTTDDGRVSRYAIRVDPAFRVLFSILGAWASIDYVEVGTATVRIRLGWLFHATIARSAITDVRHHADMYGGWGAHGWRHRWLVNGSSKGIIQLDLAPRQPARLLGVWPITLDTVFLSLVEPDGFLAEVRS
jgi:hypothetical protein